MTYAKIKDLIIARESFWLESASQRICALRIAKILGIRYRTTKDDDGGFYAMHIPNRKGKSK
jgi:aminoglycoside/choline kinase family phosphotransferase